MSLSDRDPEEVTQFDLSEDLVISPTHKPKQTNAVDFDGLLTPPLVLHEDLAKGNGGQAWPAGMILTKYILRKKQDSMKNASSIVELGAGGGLVGLGVAVGCQPNALIHITDMDAMFALMQQNIELNGLNGKVKAAVYDWGTATPEGIPQHPHVVLAADCVYFEPAFPLLQQTLQDLIGPSTVCYFCFKRRRRADMHFLKAVKKQFLVEDVLDDPDQPSYARENIFLCTIRRKAGR
ncbi:Putative lysine methyltransferase, S-adenosyl-L-methionine-dependent methyltransferase [Septoria linicola]|uniref:Protein-lysine N-methyltransferase EFM6 n=1 Tax=Septoria linicola TaxID=215465 RepID=A0A9Q9B0P7_9PEZI|nr:putative lysine methyltransferase, S-adenosyl-L-methionine-dependent methyltransferase [Septoria linicola]USW58535.1 Putative lysine methyltransferase, S-adenosyl-L-methionine-dependent methyltransferase [Septoria linicola]